MVPKKFPAEIYVVYGEHNHAAVHTYSVMRKFALHTKRVFGARSHAHARSTSQRYKIKKRTTARHRRVRTKAVRFQSITHGSRSNSKRNSRQKSIEDYCFKITIFPQKAVRFQSITHTHRSRSKRNKKAIVGDCFKFIDNKHYHEESYVVRCVSVIVAPLHLVHFAGILCQLHCARHTRSQCAAHSLTH